MNKDLGFEIFCHFDLSENLKFKFFGFLAFRMTVQNKTWNVLKQDMKIKTLPFFCILYRRIYFDIWCFFLAWDYK